jgi:hypothetical protein
MIDFSNCAVNIFKTFGGSNGKKICIEYNNEDYLLKFPSKKVEKSYIYTNGCISEYLSCHIFNSVGIKAQDTLLGIYSTETGNKEVVACKDFTDKDTKLVEFAKLKNACINSYENGYGTELKSIYQAFEEQKYIDTEKIKKYFWDMFIMDAFVGNFDRHNGNWGFLVNEKTGFISLAPIYDCGSCLYSQLPLSEYKNILSNPEEINKRIYVFPNSAIYENGNKINYFNYISSLENNDCNNALKRILPKINLQKINDIISNAGLTEEQQIFYSTMIATRKSLILDYAYEKLMERELDLHNVSKETNRTIFEKMVEPFPENYINNQNEL